MCKIGDIVVIKNYVSENGKNIGVHSFIVIDDSNGKIRGLSYDFVATVISSFKNKVHKKKKLNYEENLEIKNSHLMNNQKLKKASYVKIDKIFYFDKNNIDYYVLGKISNEYLVKILNLVSVLSEKNKLLLVTKNIENK